MQSMQKTVLQLVTLEHDHMVLCELNMVQKLEALITVSNMCIKLPIMAWIIAKKTSWSPQHYLGWYGQHTVAKKTKVVQWLQGFTQ